MRKFSIIFRTEVLLLSLMFLMGFPVLASSVSPIMGDVDLDGKVSAEDARMILRYSCNLCDLCSYQVNRANMNRDETVNSADARLALRRSVGLDKSNYANEENITWTTTYITAFYADECGGENYNTATVERILLKTYYGAIPNYAINAGKSDDGVVTYYGLNILGTTNRNVFPMKSVIEYKMGGKVFYGVVLDHNNDNNAGRRYVTLDHLFCTSAEGNRFINKYLFGNYLPISEARVIGKMNVSSGKITFY